MLIVGDAINKRGDEGLVEMYGPLQARLGKYAVAGNWENWGRVRRSAMKTHYARAGVVWLDNDQVDLERAGVRLIGLDESTNGWTEWSLVHSRTDRAATIVLHAPLAGLVRQACRSEPGAPWP